MDSTFKQAPSLLRTGCMVLLASLLAACARSPYQEEPRPAPVPPVEAPRKPEVRPAPVPVPAPPPTLPRTQKSHPRYAPPPHAAAYWDNQLNVYVVKGRDLYYRERLYYRWRGGWFCSGRPDGPWEAVEAPSVPPGLRQLH